MVQVSEPLHRDIMAALRDRNLSTTEISEALGKAQSTLSIHLDALVNMGLLKSVPDEKDSRRKIFSRSCTEVAYSKDCCKDGIAESKRLLAESISNPDTFHKFLIRAFLMNSDGKGLSISPAMKVIGGLLGDTLFGKHKPSGLEGAIELLQDFYERNGLGEVCIYTFMPLTIIVRDDYDFEYMTDSVAKFSHGVFERVLSKATGETYAVTSAEIFGTGNNYYKFILEPS